MAKLLPSSLSCTSPSPLCSEPPIAFFKIGGAAPRGSPECWGPMHSLPNHQKAFWGLPEAEKHHFRVLTSEGLLKIIPSNEFNKGLKIITSSLWPKTWSNYFWPPGWQQAQELAPPGGDSTLRDVPPGANTPSPRMSLTRYSLDEHNVHLLHYFLQA